MSMTLVNAKIYVARIIGGGAGSQESLDMAGEAILRGYQDWQNVVKKGGFWRFLLKDTTIAKAAFTAHCHSGSGLFHEPGDPTPATGVLNFINIGDTFTASAQFTGTITVLSYTRDSNGNVDSFTVDQNAAGTANVTLTPTSTNIPIVVGVNDYNLPTDFLAPYVARLLTIPRTLTWRDIRWWDRNITDSTQHGTPSDYNTYNPYSALTQNFGVTHLRFDRTPGSTDTLLLRYYRQFNTTATNIDIPDDMLYQFLDYCRNLLLVTKRAKDDPAGYARSVNEAAEGASTDDEEPTDDNDADTVMKAQYEAGGDWNRQLWNNGPFDATR